MYDPIITSETKKGVYFFYWIMGIVLSMAGCFLLLIGFREVYPELTLVLFGSFLITIGFIFIYTNAAVDRLEIYTDRVEVTSLLGRLKQTIYRNEITAWTEIRNSSKGASWMVLTLYTGEKKYRISSNSYKNYALIKEELIKDKKWDSELEKFTHRKNTIRAGCIVIAISIFFLCLTCYRYFDKKHKIMAANDLTTIKQVVRSIDISDSKSNRSIQLTLKGCRYFDFEIDKNTYKVTAVDDFIGHVKRGDTLFVTIATDEYQMKLTKEKELGFFDKTMDHRTILVYGLRDNNREYLTVDQYNKSYHSGEISNLWLSAIIGMVMAGLGLFVLSSGKRP